MPEVQKPVLGQGKEEWRPVVGYEKLYEVSLDGSIRTKKTGFLRKCQISSNGYRYIVLSEKGKSHLMFIHRILLEAFCKHKKKGQECRHLDGNKLNNSLSNIRWGTHKENIKDNVKNGKILFDSKHGKTQYPFSVVSRAKEMIKGGVQYKIIASSIGVSPTTVHDWAIGRTRRKQCLT